MSSSVEETKELSSRGRGLTEQDDAPAFHRSPARRRRIVIVLVLIAGLLTSTFARLWAVSMQDRAARTGSRAAPTAGGGPSLGSLDSYFLILLLGGLRGPLVMFLWATSESQKNERDLEDFDTKIELIRLLQPEFDSVHLFQTWNKAYNVTAQLAGLPNKYAAVLDAIEYANRVDRSRPNDLNILMTLDDLYQHKLGSSPQESKYYRRRVREDTKYRAVAGGLTGTASRRQRLDPLLDQQGNLLPQFVTPIKPRPAGLSASLYVDVGRVDDLRAAAQQAGVALPNPSLAVSPEQREILLKLDEQSARRLEATFNPVGARYVYADWNDGSDLQYLKQYEPFVDGVSPLALGVNYAKRAQVLMNQTLERPLQLSRGVVDSRPGLEFKAWADEERERAIASEAALFGRTSTKGSAADLSTADLPLDTPIADRSLLAPVLHGHELVARLCHDAIAEYTRHIHNPDPALRHFTDYDSHVDELICLQLLATADYQYLLAMTLAQRAPRDDLLRSAAKSYRDARAYYQYVDLSYYVPGEAASRVNGYERQHLADRLKDPDALATLYAKVIAVVGEHPEYDQTQSSREEYLPCQLRATQRLLQITPH